MNNTNINISQYGTISVHTVVTIVFIVISVMFVGSRVIHRSSAQLLLLDQPGCEIRGRTWSVSNRSCTKICQPGSGTLVITENYDYCSKAVTSSSVISQQNCADLGRVWLLDGCARRADQIATQNSAQCTDSRSYYFVESPYDYCGIVYALPPNQVKPQVLPAQPEADNFGANTVVSKIADSEWAKMNGISWHVGCPVGRSGLSELSVNYWGFDGHRHRGSLVINTSAVSNFTSGFTQLYKSKIPLHGMYPVEYFGYSTKTNGGDDYASMMHDNTSAFNCRWVDGSPGKLSPHAYGTAVDINPFENPYHSATGWVPNEQWSRSDIQPYSWRKKTDTVVSILLSAGFNWTYATEDSQHFDVRP